MSGLVIMTQTLLAGGPVTALSGQRIYPVAAPQDAAYPNIVLHRIHEDDPELLQGSSQWPFSRISVEHRAKGADAAAVADRMGEATIAWLMDRNNYSVAGFVAEFTKEGTDETDGSASNVQGQPDVIRRIVDFYIRWRVPAP